jgi:hypothetical protein
MGASGNSEQEDYSGEHKVGVKVGQGSSRSGSANMGMRQSPEADGYGEDQDDYDDEEPLGAEHEDNIDYGYEDPLDGESDSNEIANAQGFNQLNLQR